MGSVTSTPPGTGRRLDRRRAIITGAARGIGAEIARTYAAEGAELVLIDIAADEVHELAKTLECESAVVDLADAAATARVMTEAIELLGGVDLLVNNAGILKMAPILDMTIENWDLTFDINVRAMFVTTQVAGRAMRAQVEAGHTIGGSGGRIINMASMGGKLGSPNQAHYAASKSAVIAFTRVSAMELGCHGINVNCICPGYVLTEMGAATRTPEMVAAWSAKSPLGRLAETSDVANMALFLASDDASYCTGQAMNVSGGMVMH
ncbi:MAG: Short-chain dehydrogenase/reductase [Ilumatobacteraceae bacterium]|nr:Short-chain dehydrogenase/reductase [Ilumatobacteraceae bacterium]